MSNNPQIPELSIPSKLYANPWDSPDTVKKKSLERRRLRKNHRRAVGKQFEGRPHESVDYNPTPTKLPIATPTKLPIATPTKLPIETPTKSSLPQPSHVTPHRKRSSLSVAERLQAQRMKSDRLKAKAESRKETRNALMDAHNKTVKESEAWRKAVIDSNDTVSKECLRMDAETQAENDEAIREIDEILGGGDGSSDSSDDESVVDENTDPLPQATSNPIPVQSASTSALKRRRDSSPQVDDSTPRNKRRFIKASRPLRTTQTPSFIFERSAEKKKYILIADSGGGDSNVGVISAWRPVGVTNTFYPVNETWYDDYQIYGSCFFRRQEVVRFAVTKASIHGFGDVLFFVYNMSMNPDEGETESLLIPDTVNQNGGSVDIKRVEDGGLCGMWALQHGKDTNHFLPFNHSGREPFFNISKPTLEEFGRLPRYILNKPDSWSRDYYRLIDGRKITRDGEDITESGEDITES